MRAGLFRPCSTTLTCVRFYGTRTATLVQGLQDALPPIALPEGYPTVLQQVRDNCQKFPGCVVLTKVGGFYELYFEQAEALHRELGLRRSWKDTRLGPVAMAGFPHFQLDRYLKMLVGDMGRKVAISEERERKGADGRQLAGNLFDRQVTRIVTPGTLSSHLTDERYGSDGNEYVMSCIVNGDAIDLAWLDASTGDFYTETVTPDVLEATIRRIDPREVVSDMTDIPTTAPITPRAGSSAVDLLLGHLHDTAGDEVDLSSLTATPYCGYVRLDANAISALELNKTVRTGFFTGSLLHAIRRTVTQAGARLLAERLTAPLCSVEDINARLDVVQLLVEDEPLRMRVRNLLRDSGDAARIVQRFSFGRGDAEDLLIVAKSIETSTIVGDLIEEHPVLATLGRPQQLDSLRRRITSSVDKDGIRRRHDEVTSDLDRRPKPIERDTTFVMKKNATTALREMHTRLDAQLQQRGELTDRLKEKYGVVSLRTLPGAGHVVHTRARESPADVRVVSSTKSTRTFVLPEWTALGSEIESERSRILQEEAAAFRMLRKLVLKFAQEIRLNAHILAGLDVSLCLSELALDNGWTRPFLNDSCATSIVLGRHPVAERALERKGFQFVPNDLELDGDCVLVTGPNMGGKSTFLKQICLIHILAQMGSYVPAEHATLGCVDAIYSRIGSSDNLYEDESTFMCEMKETAVILKGATHRSLVVMDEVGRGTTVRDGFAIASAVLDELRHRRCRSLFATHFHELADGQDGLQKLCTRLENVDGEWHFSRRMQPGVCKDAHGLECARLAGVSEKVLEQAARVIAR
ncbi:hypothetical protein PYCC9005_000598 [Savitreella phatthalungensis]